MIIHIDLPLVAVHAAVQHISDAHLPAQRRRLEDREGADQVAQPFAPARLRVAAALDGAQPVERMDGVWIAQAEREW
jgi:hypothetical protein